VIRRRVGVLAASAAVLLSACTSSGTPSRGDSSHQVRPSAIIAAPAGLVAGTPPQLNGDLWVLAGGGGAKTLHKLDLTAEQFGAAVPADAGATSLAQSSSTLLGLGLATATTGAVQFLNGSTAGPVSKLAVGAPVHMVTAGADGSTFYALNGTARSTSVTIINSIANKILYTIPVPLDTVSIAVDPSQKRIFLLESDGYMEIVPAFGNQVLSRFYVGANPITAVLSNDGTTMYVLKSTDGSENVGVVDVALENQTKAIPAPAHTVDIAVSSDGSTLYDFVGTNTVGNVQIIATG
jgi:hypothetical protein